MDPAISRPRPNVHQGPSSTNRKSPLWEIAQTALLAFILAQLLVHYIVQPHHVKGASMEPNFADGDYILTDKLTYRFRPPARGEVIVFHSPKTPKTEFIKRIIGLPGDTVEIRGNKIYINGRELVETYLPYPSLAYGPNKIRGAESITVPEGSYFVLGDNRGNSYDSRYFGVIARSDIEGRTIFRYWPISEVKAITSPSY